jgi:hypothetical protein
MSLFERAIKTGPAQQQKQGKKQPFFRHPGIIPGEQSPSTIQAKPVVNTPGDAHEQEADAVADNVMRMPHAGNTSIPANKEENVQCKPEGDREEDKMQSGTTDPAPLMCKPAMAEEDHMLTGERDAAPQHRAAMGMDEEDHMRDGGVDLAPLQRKEQPGMASGRPVSASFQQGLNSSKGGGSPLPDDVKQQMEADIGADFSKVRIHTGGDAAQLSSSIQAQAFTHGNDIYFNEGKYNPGSSSGKHLLAHELAHTVQQRGAPAIQRAFTPEDAAQEMVGRKFAINTALKSGDDPIPAGTSIVITSWSNTDPTVTGKIVLGNKAKIVKVDKCYLDTVANSVQGISGYKAGVKGVETTIGANAKALADYEAQRGVYEKASKTDKTAMPRFNKELERQKGAQEKRYADLNQKLIQETMYNAFDPQIKNWVDYYHEQIGKGRGWVKLDYNLVKSMVFQETQMGTAGVHLNAIPKSEDDRKTRYNLIQAIDSSGDILSLMINEIDPQLFSKYNIATVKTDLIKAQARLPELLKKENLKKITVDEAKELIELKYRSGYNNGDTNWNTFYWTDQNFAKAWSEFNHKSAKKRNVDYDFWLRAGIRWLYEKRRAVSSWEEAIRAFNGSGPDARAYRDSVVTRRNSAIKGNNQFVPPQPK